MREIEIKARVVDDGSLRQALEGAGIKLSEPIKQHDIVWLEPGAKISDMVGRNVLRIRTENDTTSIFTLKKTIADLDKLEHETVIEEPSEMRAAIELMGYELYAEVTKTRRKANYSGYEICLDQIEGLGTFIEVEKLTDESASGDEVRKELWSVLSQLGIDRKHEVTKGYDILMHEHVAISSSEQIR